MTEIHKKDILDAFHTLDEVESFEKSSSKLETLEAASGNLALRTFFLLALDSRKRYGVYPELSWEREGREKGTVSTEEQYAAFIDLLKSLAKRDLTGNAAKEELRSFLASCTRLEHKWYSRIVNRDLRIGVGAKTALKVWPKLFPTFDVQLAQAHKPNDKNGYLNLDYPLLVEPKYDGIRFVVIVKNGHASLVSRNGIEYPAWYPYLAQPFESVCANGVFDGEVTAASWNAVSSIMRKREPTEKEVKKALKQISFKLFDFIPLKDFEAGESDLILGGFHYDEDCRWKRLQKYASQIDSSLIELMPQADAHSKEEVVVVYEHYLEQGLEGAMLKRIDGKYLCGERSRSRRYWLKLKPEDESSGTVVEVIEGKGKLAGTLGAFVVEFEKDGKTVRLNVGGSYNGSLTEDKRISFWKIRKQLVGKIIDFKHETIVGGDCISRFARFVRFREDLS